MKRLRRQRLEAALTEVFTVESSGEGYALAFDGVPSFSLLDWIKPWLARKIEHEHLTITVPTAINASLSVDSSGTLKVSLREPIKVQWHRGIVHATVQCYGFTEYPERYALDLKWAGLLPIPISISKPGHGDDS